MKLAEPSTGKTVLTVYVWGGVPEQVDVPLGTFAVKYAHGYRWCGDELLFGEGTTYAMADTELTFSIDGNRIAGNSIELIPQTNGNLSTRAIDAAGFR